MEMEQNIKKQLGELLFAIVVLQTQNEQLQKTIDKNDEEIAMLRVDTREHLK